MEIITILLGLVALVILIMAIRGIKIISQAEVMVIERLGKFHRLAKSGLNIIWPFFDAPKAIHVRVMKTDVTGQPFVYDKIVDRIDIREQVLDFPKQAVITKDNVTMDINSVIYYQITDPVKSVYEIANLPDAIEKLTKTTLRNIVGDMELDTTLTSREIINAKLRKVLDEATDKWGVKVTRVEIQDIEPPREIKDAMEKQMRAERDRRALILEAEGNKKAKILQAEGIREAAIAEAEGKKKATILEAEGLAEARLKVAEAEAEAIRKISLAISPEKSANYLIALKYIEALHRIADGKATKIFLPYEISSILSSIGGIQQLIFKAEE